MPKQRAHNEWFRPVTSKTNCPCGKRQVEVWSWGEYVRAKWRTVDYFCRFCFDTRIVSQLLAHVTDCGCIVQLCAKSGYTLPSWIQLPTYPVNCKPIKENVAST